MSSQDSWQIRKEAKQKLLEPLVQRAISHVRFTVVDLIHVPVASNEEILGAGGWNFFR